MTLHHAQSACHALLHEGYYARKLDPATTSSVLRLSLSSAPSIHLQCARTEQIIADTKNVTNTAEYQRPPEIRQRERGRGGSRDKVCGEGGEGREGQLEGKRTIEGKRLSVEDVDAGTA